MAETNSILNIFCHVPRERWVVDRMGLEFIAGSRHNITSTEINAKTNLIWLLGSWCWNTLPEKVLNHFPVVCTIHHEVPEKFDAKRKDNFLKRDKFVNFYLAYTEETKKLINSLSSKPVNIIPHWINTGLWKKLDKLACQNTLDIPSDKFIIGSFQRDTEGSDLKTPKLEKGPDIFVKNVLEISKLRDVHVLLGGKRRQFIIKLLKENKIPYTYLELPSSEVINKMYNCLDLYIVSSRCEGGPQAIFECGYLEVPIISTRCGQHNLLEEQCKYDIGQAMSESLIKGSESAVQGNKISIDKLADHVHIEKYDQYFERIKVLPRN